MQRDRLIELHYIAPIANLPSIMRHGLLSHRRARQYNPVSVALQDVQDIRARKRVPGGGWLHDYVNLYVCARNPMLYKRLAEHKTMCVLSVQPTALDLPGTVVTDQNAASNYVRFAGLDIVDEDRTFAEYWTHPGDQPMEWRHAAQKCAEVLVPDRAAPDMIRKAYVSGLTAQAAITGLRLGLATEIHRHLFFNVGDGND
jgi:hypothetical protein